MTDKPQDEKRSEQDRAAFSSEGEVEGHRRFYKPEEPSVRALAEDESPEVEGHRFHKPEEPGARA